jgi:hypothetical protein
MYIIYVEGHVMDSYFTDDEAIVIYFMLKEFAQNVSLKYYRKYLG